jgi:hypothetical protein
LSIFEVASLESDTMHFYYKPILILCTGLLSLLSACANDKPVPEIKKDRYYFAHYRQRHSRVDTTYIDSLDRDLTGLTKIYAMSFDDLGGVIKYANYQTAIDGEYLCYYTESFGIIYTKSITWKNFSRLHSSNDSIERVLNTWFSYILSNQSLVLAGEDFVKYGDSLIMLGDMRTPKLHMKNK